MEADYEGFSIREYTRKIRSVELRKCWPFSGEITGDLIQSLLPPITVAKFRWWSHELASLLAKSPVTVDDSSPAFRRKGKPKSRPCKKRSIVEIFAAAPPIQLTRREEVNNCKELVGEKVDGEKCSLGIKENSGVMFLSSKKDGSVSKVEDSEFQIPGILKAKRKVCSVRNSDKSKIYAPQCDERHVRFSDQSGKLSQMKKSFASLELCCLEMNRLSLFSPEDQSSVNDKTTKVVLNDQTSADMKLECMQQSKFQPAASERWLSHVLGKPVLPCFPGPYLSSQERVKGYVAQPIQSFTSSSSESQYRSCSSASQPASADMHCGTLLYQSPFDPVLVERMQKSVLYRQRHVDEAILGFPLNSQDELIEPNGEGCTSFDRSGLGTGSSRFASAENDLLLRNLVDFSSGKKHSIEPALAKDSVGKFPVHNEKRHKYFPARLGIDETFTEKAFFISDTNDGECGQTVHSPVSEVNLRSHTINLPKQDGLNQNLNSRNMVANPDGLCLHNTQATMRLMGKNVSVGTSYSDMVRTGERIIAPDASIDRSFLETHTHQSWLCQRTTLGISENHSTTSLDKNWNRNLLCDTSKNPFPLLCEPNVSLATQSRTAVVPDSEFPPTILYPCGSLLSSCPLTDKDLSFHGSDLRQQPNSFTFSQQQLPFPSNAGLPSDYTNLGIGLLPDGTKPSFGLPFYCTNSTRQSQSQWPQCSFESSCSRMYFIDPAEQLVSFYGPKPSSCINVGKAKKRLASVEEYPMKNQKLPKFPMQSSLNSEKEFFAGQQIRKSQI